MNRIKKYGMRIIFIQALVATAWSLYYGRYGDPIANIQSWDIFNPANAMDPCLWCWYARICMYPVVLLSAVWLWKKTRDAIDYIIPFAIVWILVEIYQVAQLYLPQIRGVCAIENPCFIPKVNYFGRLTIPLMCLVAFLVILFVALLIKKANKSQ